MDNLNTELAKMVDATLNLGGRGLKFSSATPLAGTLPELDSMGVVTLLAALEEQYNIEIGDTDIDETVFRTFGSFCDFVSRCIDPAA